MLPGLMDFLHDVIPFRIVSQGTLSAEKALTWLPGRACNQRHLHFDFLAFSYAGVFVEFDGLAVDSAVNGSGHGPLLLIVGFALW
ncbi:hypothetical protein Sinac_1957 [Singulisphaera acidiphila DSM 18658]|uniref:Uncharacterized protein n=1 Tax=Singulisphaera acidiphila (strain ATCC BAA-1392 / DSM 18658 / VKM B-2454 / MOB10) TaxID=886293 RepID=L0DAN4_SINAD|nr:hypothetical protein Sinac_1957 [Singulisphaera acidiphila DSM 18658]